MIFIFMQIDFDSFLILLSAFTIFQMLLQKNTIILLGNIYCMLLTKDFVKEVIDTLA